MTRNTPWHHSTPAVLGASVAGLAAIALVVAAVMFVGRQNNQPTPAPTDFVDPTFTTTSTTETTTPTITRTSPSSTTDIYAPTELPPTTTTTTSPTSETPTEEDEETTTRTRSRPRTNVTRTLYPQPPN
ncbi:hypothetical protein [Mycobacterium hubeiense]|uniref:hypothetical protein n=1 Tax=Mycobacterium hubeiense TaxID=1867256 RepID=UPI000C7F1BBB|nr:hypothetical protein [Mycobacterium sp. QGD 101]